MKTVSIAGHLNPYTQLRKNGFSVDKKSGTLNKRGTKYKLTRSLSRALKAWDAGCHNTDFNFQLMELKRGATKKSAKKTPTKTKCVVTDNTIAFFYDGCCHQASKGNPTFNDIVKLVQKGDLAKAAQLTNIAKAIDEVSNGVIKNRDGVLTHNNEELEETVTEWLVRNMGGNELAVAAVVNFMKKCKLNPEPKSIEMLWQFIRKNGLILFPDGDFLGYRYVNDDLKDCYTNTYDNTPGKECKMRREDVTYDPTIHCSSGLHVGAWSHVANNPNIIEVKVSPENVVSVPEGEDWKMRVCSFFSWKLLKHKGVEIAPMTVEFVKL